MWLGLRSGRRFPYGLQTSDPVALIEAIAGGGAPDETREAAQGLAARYASSRPAGPRRWYPPILKFVVFALVPALPLFRLHQWVAYGGTFGEYYTYGLRAYLLGFAVYWSTCAIYLVSYAAVLRAGVELAVFATAWAAPGRVAAVRRAAEIVQRLAYYSGVSVFLLGVALSTT